MQIKSLVKKMIPGAKQRTVDRISDLPRHIIDNILDRMLICDAARTCILSKTWKNIWETHPNILLVKQFIDQVMKNKTAATTRYVGVINSILLAHVGSILKFSLYIPAHLHLNGTPYPCLWIKQLSEKRVKVLELSNSTSNPVKDMPSYLFSCSDLTKLVLLNWKLKPPRKFGGFSNLTAISLEFVVFTTDMSFGSQVQHFQLRYCAGIEHLESQLTNHGKNIKYFDIKRSLIKEKLYTYAHSPQTDIKKKFDLRRLLGHMPSIETLEVDAISLAYLDPGSVRNDHLTSTMENLKTFKLHYFPFSDLLVCAHAFCLLRSTPYLERLEIEVGPDVDKLAMHSMLTAEQYMKFRFGANVTLDKLQNVTFRNFSGSRAELLITKILLASSRSLKRMTIVRNTAGNDPKQDFSIARELLQFPRKSPVEITWRS